ncbi:hypothetical protein [Infirmifilum uzonense]|jgi:hypothetical protein|uniref:hypothetical protein n=1 Tax=Infirmifilum TaxID=2856573 RepID=UPI002352027D
MKSILRLYRLPGIHVIYGPPGSCKTRFSIFTGRLIAGTSPLLYAGLGRHSIISPEESEEIKVVRIQNLKSEISFLLSLEKLSGNFGSLVYDGFSIYFLPLRFYMRETSISKLQLFAASKLHEFSQRRSIPLIVTAQEISGRKPLAYKILRRFSRDFTRLEKVDEKIVVHVYDRNLYEKFTESIDGCFEEKASR